MDKQLPETLSPEIPEFTDKTKAKRQKFSVKPLFKFRIKDLFDMYYDEIKECFKFKHYDVNLVMCSGKIVDIFRDDTIFSFEINDDSGDIHCFHKFKQNPNIWLDDLNGMPRSVKFLQNTLISYLSTIPEETTIFNATSNDTVVKKFEYDTNETINQVLNWFDHEVVNKQKLRKVGDLIHITGHLIENEFVRKINVIDFRIVENEDENKDFLLEIEYLHKFVYV